MKYGLVGSSDILGVYKGFIVCCECKALGKRIKPDSTQDKFLKMINAQGGIAFECDNPENIKELLYNHPNICNK